MKDGKEIVNGISVYRISGEPRFVIEAGFSRLDGMTEAEFDQAKTKFRDLLTKNLSQE